MHKLSYTPDPTNSHDHIQVDISTEAVSLDDLLEAFERYLKATGFSFSGHIDIVEEER